MKKENSHLLIAIQGWGAAGRARYESIPHIAGLKCAGIISRRPEVATLSLAKALSDPAIEAMAISLENTQHAPAVKQALEAGKHVLCDYPLALSGAEGRHLFALARHQRRILHVEHIGLLTSEHQELKKQVQGLGALKKGDYLFQGGWNQKLSDPSRTGPFPILALPRLLQVADLFGPFTVENREIKIQEKGFFLHLHLKFQSGGMLGFTEERLEGMPRRRSLVAQCEGGPLHWKAGTEGGGLFGKDLAWFRDRVLYERPCYYDEELMLEVLGVLEKMMEKGKK